MLRLTGAIYELLEHNPTTRQLNEWFRNNCRGLGIEVDAYFEMYPTYGRLVVDADSANPFVEGIIPIPVPENHLSISKPAGPDADIHIQLIGFIERSLEAVGRQLASNREHTLDIPKCIFLHFLDHYVLQLSGVQRRLTRRMAKHLTNALRLALLTSDRVFVPAVSYFQSPACRYILREFQESIDLGVVQLVGDAYSFEAFFENRLREYDSNSSEFELYSRAKNRSLLLPDLTAVDGNTTYAIHQQWANMFAESDPIEFFAPRVGLALAKLV